MHLIAEEEFAQKASPVASLRAILEGHPLSPRILTELVQNSDDARASKQIFVLDQREHATEGLYSEGLASAQGPAFMAFNDGADLSTQDWQALSSMHDSSKTEDESKIGKYGVGFRSVFNLTDCPQILSAPHLVIFDPLCLHLGSEGKRFDLGDVSSAFPNQLLPFDHFMNVRGTVIRCPLRKAPSRISDQIVQSGTISDLFKEFIDQEIGISCLFLNNIKCIEIYEISPTRVSSLLAKMVISRSDPITSTMFKATVQLDRNQVTERREWYILQSNFSRDEAIEMFKQQPGYNHSAISVAQVAKFSPEVKIAVDITRATPGRLFSFLPLPIFTGFPVHVHALFGIDASRTNLRRNSVGLASGSQDHTKVQWNTLLFQTLLPRTWSCLLEAMVNKGLVTNIFSIWPPEKCSGELESYCTSLSEQLVHALLASTAAVWPIYEPQNLSVQFGSLDTLVVASPADREVVLRALARAGVSLTRPPSYIFNVLCNSSGNRILNPDMAHELLLEKVDKIPQASEEDQKLLLEYLLSTDNVLNVCGLPLIPIASGEKVKITNADGDPTYTMLTRSEFDIFGPCDGSAIPLHRLPPHVEDTLLKFGPRLVNVQRLAVPRLVEYLSMYPNHLGNLSEGKTDSSAVRWLSRFWEWMNLYEDRDKLFPQIQNFFLLPSTRGLRKADSALFRLRGEHPAYTAGYLALGVPFLASDFSEAAHGVLQHYGLAKLIWDIPALLDSLASIRLAEVAKFECESILKHLASRLDESIGQDRIRRLRDLPIFPVLTHSTTGNSSSVVTNWTTIPQGHVVRSIGRPKFVPLVNGISFVDLNNIAPGMVKFLESSHPNSMSENDIIELAVENFITQPEHLQLIVLQHITKNKNRIFPAVVAKLRSQAFVLAEDGGFHVPEDIVDPDSDIAPLYIGCPEYRPLTIGRFWLESSQCLRSLRLLRTHLTPEIATERIEYISSRHTSEEALLIARNLLLLLGSTNLDCSLVQGISEKNWLPTNKGIRSAKECREAALTPPVLFDKVLAILSVLGGFAMSHSLRAALGWDKPLPTKLLIEQLNVVLNTDHVYESVVEIVKEFGRRQWSDEDVAFLEGIVRDRQWIPTTGGMLSDIKSSVFEFSPMMVNSGFCQIRTDLKADRLLRRMGCCDCPSTRAILDKLHSLDQDSNHLDLVSTSISLLKSLSDDIANMDRVKLLIPDKDSRLRPCSKVFYNDIGEKYRLVSTDGHFIAHPSVDESLARKLALVRLGLSHDDLRNIGPNMGQSPLTTVRGTLRQYTPKQFLLEFLANAEDARAIEFKVAINLNIVHEEQNLRVLSSAMAYLCKLPSLVVYNNAQFTSQDFEGICRTSVGGKDGRSDTIGEFGQGVLTMYHLTDLAIIISGSQVLFMDPAKKHLPLTDVASLTLPLLRVQQFYKDHLITLNGLFDFDMSVPFYDGTLFVLPLRACDSLSHPSHEFIVSDFWSPERLTSEILEPFRAFASDCLLFTDIRTISCFTRADRSAVLEWSFSAARERQIMGGEAEYGVTDIEITKHPNSVAHWKTVTTGSELPSQFQVEASLFRRRPFAGLATRLDRVSPEGDSFNFFSILPLSTPTTLPMHVMASFKLSSDRRQIRLDSYKKLEMSYNTWLLEDLIPPLYLFFLEHLLQSGDEHYRLRWPTDKGDPLSNHIVKSFYSRKHLTCSARRLFPSLFSPPLSLSPQDAVLQFNERPNVRAIIDRLKPDQLVDLPSGPRELAERAGVSIVDPEFIKNQILLNPEAITSDIDLQTIRDVIHYLIRGEDRPSDILHGLKILPLEDGSFGTFNNRLIGTPYYLWKPKDQTRTHNFSEGHFVHPKLKIKELVQEKMNLNIYLLDVSTIKGFIEAKLSTFPDSELSVSPAQLQWTDSFWESWDEYASPNIGLVPGDVASVPLVPTTSSSSLVCLDQCKNGDVLLVADAQHSRALRTCLRELGLPVVHIDGQIPPALHNILKHDAFPRLNFPNALLAISRTGVPIQTLFGSLDDDLRTEFANWARANVSQISEPHQISLAQHLPIWWSAGGGKQPALRPGSELHLLPENLTLRDAARFMADCVAEDAGLKHLNKKHMTFDELPGRLRLPRVLDMPTLLHYKQFYETWIKHVRLLSCSNPLLVPTAANTFKSPQDLYKRGPLFEAVLTEDSNLFVHSEFQEFEDVLERFGLKTEENLDATMFAECANSLDEDDRINAVPRGRQLFRAYSNILPNRIGEQDTWRELDDIAFIPRRMDSLRRLPDQGEDEVGLDIPMSVTELPAILTPADFVRGEFEAIAWSQRACFEVQPSERARFEYPELGRPSFTVVLAHLRYLSEQSKASLSMHGPRRHRILLHDLREVYKYLDDNLDLLLRNEELAQTVLLTLREEKLFLNVNGEDDPFNWVQGNGLAFDCHDGEGPVQDVREFLFPFERILEASGVLRVQHPSYNAVGDYAQQSELVKLQSIWSSFDQLRKQKVLTDVELIAQATTTTANVPHPEPLSAHQVILAASSEYFKNYFAADFQESRNASRASPFLVKVEYSWPCVRAFLDHIYTGNKGEECSLDLLLEILDFSDYYHVIDLFNEVQGEIIQRRLLRPDTVDRIKAEAEKKRAASLLNACTQYELENKAFLTRFVTRSAIA